MTFETKQSEKAAKALRRLQSEHKQRTRQIGKLGNKLEKRRRRLRRLELNMAQLERRAHGPGPDSQPGAAGPQARRRARLIINNNSGSFARQCDSPQKLVETLSQHGIQAELYLKTSSKAVRQWVREAVKQGEELVIAAGGDGTIEDVAAELVGSDTALGIVPTGTMNNLARALGIPLDIEQACALVGTGITRPVDVGRVRSSGKASDRFFLETAGLGLSIALPAGQNIKKGRWGKLPSAFRKMFNRNNQPIEIELDSGEKLETHVQLVTVSNSPLFGLNNLIAPDAKMDDGLLDLAVYDGLSDLDLAAYFLKTANGQRVSNPNVHFYRTRQAKIRAAQEIPVTADKDELPDRRELEYELIPRAVRVIVGQGFGLVWPVEGVASVPPLSGAQAQAANVPAAEAARPTNGHEKGAPTEPAPVPEGAR